MGTSSQQVLDSALRHYEAGRFAEAQQRCRELLAREPENAGALNLLGIMLAQAGENEALEVLEKAVRAAPAETDYLINLAHAYGDLGQYEPAMCCYGRIVERLPEAPAAHNYLGNMAWRLGRLQEAESSYRRAIALAPDFAAAHTNLGVVLRDQQRISEAEQSMLRAVELDPSSAEAHNNLGNVLLSLGRPGEAAGCYRKALELQPAFPNAHSNLIFVLDFLEGCTVSEQQAERRRWHERHARPFSAAIAPHANPRQPERRLRLGYVSADFCSHSAHAIFGPIVRSHERAAFEVYCYSGVVREDQETARTRSAVDHWRSTGSLSDDALAGLIREDRIDILVDLSGHTSEHRLLAFARKPAPIQVHAWGHATGTGLQAMDYFLADPVLVPAHERRYYAEAVFDLPCSVCVGPPDPLPPLEPLPALAGKGFTFGCANRIEKLTQATIALWARILAACPEAGLLIKDRTLDDAQVRAKVLGLLSDAGIAAERVRFVGATTRAGHLEAFAHVDVALDPFPQGGGVSTAEGLWMGVPAVALKGETPASRASASMLTALDMADWVARDAEEYLRIAVAAASDISRLARLRSGLRERLAASPVGDARRYCRAVEDAYRAMWRRWCAKHDG